MPKPKWYRNDVHLKVGDVVLFNKVEGSLGGGVYKFGMVATVQPGADGHIRSVTIVYRNSSEAVDRLTVRAVRSLVVIHRVDELNIAEELGRATLIPDPASAQPIVDSPGSCLSWTPGFAVLLTVDSPGS